MIFPIVSPPDVMQCTVLVPLHNQMWFNIAHPKKKKKKKNGTTKLNLIYSTALRCGSWNFRFCDASFAPSSKATIYGKQWCFHIIIFSLVSKVINLDETFKMVSQKYQKHLEIMDWKVLPFDLKTIGTAFWENLEMPNLLC